MNDQRVSAPMSFERLMEHRAEHADSPESRRVWFFHSHTYFDHESPHEVDVARSFMELIRSTFAANAHVELSSWMATAAGPHPRGNFEVLFTREAFTEYVSWLMFTRPSSLSILVHALTRSLAADHSTRALWLGPPVSVGIAMLEAAEARNAEAGRTEESIIEGAKKH